MNIDSALRMIDNEISNFGGQIKMQAGLMLPGARRGDSTETGGQKGGGAGDKLEAKDCSDDGDVWRILITITLTEGGGGEGGQEQEVEMWFSAWL